MQRLACVAALAAVLCAHPAAGEDYPTRPIRVITPLGAGGTSDIFIRSLGEELRKSWGQPTIVENRPGGALNIGARACAEAAPDGYTICIMPTEVMVYNQHLFKNLPFDPEKSFEPITNLFVLTAALVVNPTLNVKSMAELIALAKTRPGTLSYGTFAVPLTLYLEKIKQDNGLDWVRVPFRGGADAVNAVMSGSTPIGFMGLSNMVAQVESGLLTPLVVDGTTRSRLLPDVPTLPETGYRERILRSWFGLFAPAGTPKPIVARLAGEVGRILADADFVQRNLIARGLEPAASSPEEFARYLAAYRADAAGVIERAGLATQ